MNYLNVLFISTLLLGKVSIAQTQHEIYIFPTLDQSVLELWSAAKNENIKECTELLSEVKLNWLQVSNEMCVYETSKESIDLFVKRVDDIIETLTKARFLKSYNYIELYSLRILFEFKDLRRQNELHYYSLDHLLDIYYQHYKIQKAANDPMLDLMEWTEFEHEIEVLKKAIDNYSLSCLSEALYLCDTGLNEENEIQLEIVKTCLNTLIESLKHSNQDETIIPCEDLGYAIDNLLHLYIN